MKFLTCVALAAASSLAFSSPASAQSSGVYGDVAIVNAGPASNPNVFELTSNTSGAGYGGLFTEFGGPFSLSSLTQLSADYQMVTGTFGGGSPRFTLLDGASNAAYIYFGTPQAGGTFTDPNAGGYGNTGNLADLLSGDLRVQSNGFGGYNSGYPYITFADLVANAGLTNIQYATLDLDGGTFTNLPDGQRMLADNFPVNSNVFAAADVGAVPEASTWAMMLLGFGGIGVALRRRRDPALALAA